MARARLPLTVTTRGVRAAAHALAALVALCAASAAQSAPPTLAKGRLLIADRALVDPNFAQAVVLVLEYSAEGALGVIVNRPAGISPRALLPGLAELSNYEGSVYLGGPVGVDRLVLLVRECGALADTTPAFDGVCYSGSGALLARLAQQGATSSRLRVYVGFSGWGAGQLETEIAHGDWHVIEAREDLVFAPQPGTLWQELAPPPRPLETRSPGESSRALVATAGHAEEGRRNTE